MSEKQRQRQQIQSLKIEPNEDVVSIRDRLQFVERRRVLLVLPEQGNQLHRKLDLLLVQREAAKLNLQLALLSDDPEVAEHANEINLSCFYTLRQARIRRWKNPRTTFFTDHRGQRPRDSVEHPYELMHLASRLKPNLTTRQARLRLLGRIAVGILVFFVVFGGIIATVPSATVTLTPATDAINEPIPMIADTTITALDVENSLVPAQMINIITLGDTVTVDTSGTRDAEDTLAQGRVLFTNESGNSLFIASGTVVSTLQNPPQRFRTTNDVALAAEIGAIGESSVVALADTQGLNGNVPADTITRVEGDLETLVSVTNPNPTFGGGLVQLSVVTDADRERLLTLGRQAVIQGARNELLLQLPNDDKFLVPDSIRIVEERPEWTTFTSNVGDDAESVSLNLRARVEAVVVDLLQARQLAFIRLSQRLPAGRELNESSLTYQRENGTITPDGRYAFQLFVEGNTPFAIDTEQAAERINGLTIAQAKATLERDWVLDPQSPPLIQTYPVNVGIMPLLPVRITIVVQRP